MPRNKTMRKAALLVFIAAFMPVVVAASSHIVRHSSIPETYWGTWAPADATCKDADRSGLVLSERTYASSTTNCAVEAVYETPSPKGVVYAARLQCSNSTGQELQKTTANLIIRPAEGNQIDIGPDFPSLKPYQRCSAGGSSANP